MEEIKFYNVDLDDLSIIGVKLPAALFDLVSLVLLIWSIYQLLINWIVDIVSFQKWYQSRNLWSDFQTNITILVLFFKKDVIGITILNQVIEMTAVDPQTH